MLGRHFHCELESQENIPLQQGSNSSRKMGLCLIFSSYAKSGDLFHIQREAFFLALYLSPDNFSRVSERLMMPIRDRGSAFQSAEILAIAPLLSHAFTHNLISVFHATGEFLSGSE